MIKFFRKIRQRLLQENRISRYLIYAIGEIFLVVIGILIALQINNWNENRKDRRKEKIYLAEFQLDLEACNKELQRTIGRTQRLYDITDTLLLFAYKDSFPRDPQVLSKLLHGAVGWTTFLTNDGTVNEILNGGNLNFISHPTLRSSIASWHADMKVLEVNEAVLRKFVEDYYALLIEHTDYISSKYQILPSIPSEDIKILFNLKQFRNTLYEMNARNKKINEFYLDKEKYIDSIYAIVETELDRFK